MKEILIPSRRSRDVISVTMFDMKTRRYKQVRFILGRLHLLCSHKVRFIEARSYVESLFHLYKRRADQVQR